MSESQKAVSKLEKMREKNIEKIQYLKSQKGFKEAYEKIIKTRDITTAELDFFGLPFEYFLRYAKMSEEKCKEFIDNLIEVFK